MKKPTPQQQLQDLESEYGAAFIVRAVNAYEANEKKIRILQRLLEKATGWTCEQIAEAITKAEVK